MFLVSFQFCSLFIYFIGLFCFFPTVFNDIFSSPAGRKHVPRSGSVSNAHALHVSASAARASNAFAFVFPLHFIYREKLLFPGSNSQYIFNIRCTAFSISPIHRCLRSVRAASIHPRFVCAFFLSSVFAAQSAAPSPILSDNQKSAEHLPQDTGSICRGR